MNEQIYLQVLFQKMILINGIKIEMREGNEISSLEYM